MIESNTLLGKHTMDMQTYLNEIEHAASVSINAVWNERIEAEALEERVSKLTAEMEEGYRRAAVFQECEDPDDVMLGVGIHWDTYFGADKERYHAQDDLNTVQAKLSVRQFSVDSLSASLLQFAKQGISIVHGGLTNCPHGHAVGSQTIAAIIWQSRNHSLHWEGGSFRSPVATCFSALEAEVDPKFGQYTNRNMAFEVVELLGWRSFQEFSNDLLSIA
jgi:hypothetical protein